MNKNTASLKKVQYIVYLAVLFAIFIYTLFFTDVFQPGVETRVKGYSDGWILQNGEEIKLDGIKDKKFSDTVTVEKKLPEDIRSVDSFCFQSKNVNILAMIDGKEVYRFKSRENLTGAGYGFTTHEIGLDSDMAGSVISISYDSVLPGYTGGYIWGACICSGSDYIRMLTQQNMFLLIISLIILFLGIFLVFVWFIMPDRAILPFNILSLGIMSALFGVWSLVDTGLPTIFSGHLYAGRVLSRVLLIIVLYPFFCFIYSLTEKKRSVYRNIVFFTVMSAVAVSIVFRYVFGHDMISTFVYAIIISLSVVMITILVMAFDDIGVCKSVGKTSKFSDLSIGIIIFALCCMMEILSYSLGLSPTGRYFVFIRLGIAGFIACVFAIFLKWWAGDRALVERDQFVSKALQFSVSSATPEESLRRLLEYIGTEFQVRAACLFEEEKDGGYRLRYEWCKDKLEYNLSTSMIIPMEHILKQIDNEHNCIEIESIAQCEKILPEAAEIMKQRGIDGIVSGLIEAEGVTVGVLELQDPPKERLTEIEEVIHAVSYFFAQFIRQRKEQDYILYYSHHDLITGVKNNVAYKEYTERRLDLSQSFGYLLCEISGLKKINDKEGFDAGNEILKTAARKLMDTFGEENVFHLGGQMFAAFGFETDETFFRNDVSRVKRGMIDGKCQYSFGALYCANGTVSLETVRKKALELMNRDREVIEVKGN
ncbi:MAG: GGDEF domain-containing protein [Lachnospiraceae bacterium]|nr:GGDEF domain-containing protein [Lachnospiraceae bacterium]